MGKVTSCLGYVYDLETGLYYLQSRYYNPEIGRFINADDYVFTNKGLSSYNTFAYCLNNPANYVDNKGTFPWAVVGIAVLVIVAIGVDHALAANQPDGGYALVNEQRDNGSIIKGLYANGNGFTADANGITLCDTEAGLFSLSVKDKYTEITPLDCFTASAAAHFDYTSGIPSIKASAVVSMYSPGIEFTIPCGSYRVTVSAEALIGAMGIGFESDWDAGKIKITPPTKGVGYSVDVSFSCVN